MAKKRSKKQFAEYWNDYSSDDFKTIKKKRKT